MLPKKTRVFSRSLRNPFLDFEGPENLEGFLGISFLGFVNFWKGIFLNLSKTFRKSEIFGGMENPWFSTTFLYSTHLSRVMFGYEFLTVGNFLFFLLILAVVVIILLASFIFFRFGGILSGIAKFFLIILVMFVLISLIMGIIDVPNNVTSFVVKALNTTP